MADLKQEIQARQTELSELLSAGDLDKVVTFYTEDCKVMAPGHEMVSGREGLKKLAEKMAGLQEKVGKTEATVEEVFGSGDVVTSRAKGTANAKDGSVLFQTNSLSVWKKIDGKWFVNNYIWNADRSLPGI